MVVADLTTFRAAMRQAAVDLLVDFREDAGIKLQIYRARPTSIAPPTAFVDSIRETITDIGHIIQRTPLVEVVVLHGLFDSADAADQGDAFVDGFIDWVRPRFHSAGANSLIRTASTEDDPNYIPNWQRSEIQKTYYATLITLEGFAGG